MNEVEKVTSITWEAQAHHKEKSSDWYWVLGIGTITIVVVSLLLQNTLFAFLVLIAGVVVALAAGRVESPVAYAVTTRGIRTGDNIYPYSTLESFFITEEEAGETVLLVKSQKFFAPLLVLVLPLEHVDEVEELVASRLPEEPLEEPILQRFIDQIGF